MKNFKTTEDICKSLGMSYTVQSNVVDRDITVTKITAALMDIAKNVAHSLGPYGSTTIVQRNDGQHQMTKDGYDIISQLNYSDPIFNTVLDIVRKVASQQVRKVGDGSTSVIVVANALYHELTKPENEEFFKMTAPKDIIDILNDISKDLEEEIRKSGIPFNDDYSILEKIATVSTNNDKDAGALVANTYRQIGKYGFATTDIRKEVLKDTVDFTNGYSWDRGAIDPCFYERCIKETVEEDDVSVFISNRTLTPDDINIVADAIGTVAKENPDGHLLIIANGYDAGLRNFLISNRTKHLFKKNTKELRFTAVDIEQYFQQSKLMLKDMAVFCGCEIYDPIDSSFTPELQESADIHIYLGKVKHISVTGKYTKIFGNNPASNEQVKTLVSKLEQEYEEQKLTDAEIDSDDAYIYKKRLAALTGGNAVINVGGKTETERRTRERLIEDAVLACKSVISYGYIVGGNITIPRILSDKKFRKALISKLVKKYEYLPNEDNSVFFNKFLDLVKDSFLESYSAVLSNSYLPEESINSIIDECVNNNVFYNLKTHTFENQNNLSVINSTDTDVQILNSVTSIIGMLATSNQMLLINLAITAGIK